MHSEGYGCVCVCVRACVRVCVRACMRACVRACVCVCVVSRQWRSKHARFLLRCRDPALPPLKAGHGWAYALYNTTCGAKGSQL